MRYIVEIIEPQYIEVEASSEEQALQIVKNSIQDPRIRDYVELKIVKETPHNK